MSTIQLSAASSWVDKVGKNLHKAALDAAHSAVLRGERDIKSGALGKVPANRGTYKAGWHSIRMPWGARLYNQTYPQAPIIEHGVPPENVKVSRAMIEALSEWAAMNRKSVFKKTKTYIAKSRESVELLSQTSDVRSAAWAIAMSIKKKGLFRGEGGFGLHFIDKVTPVLIAEFKAAFARFAKAA